MHIQNNTLDNRVLFRAPVDYRHFINALARLSRTSESVQVIGYLLKKDGYHLILKEHTRGDASKFMQKLTVSYTSYMQSRYSLEGKVFKGPYKDKVLTTDDDLVKALTQIHKNEIEPGIEPEKYQWSSYQKYLKQQAPWLHKDPIIKYFSGTSVAEALRAF